MDYFNKTGLDKKRYFRSISLKANESKTIIILVIFSVLLIISSFVQSLVIPVSVALLVFFVLLSAGGNDLLLIVSYVYIIIWENKTSIFGQSCVSVISVLVAFYFLLSCTKKKIKIQARDIFLLISVLAYGGMCLLTTSNPSGIVLITDTIIAIYAHNTMRHHDMNNANRFWPVFFKFIFVSVVLSIISGYFDILTGNAQTVYLSGYVQRMGGTVGTDRIGMLLCAALIYPLYYEKSKKKSIIEAVFIVLAAVVTRGGTAYLGIFIFVMAYGCFRLRDSQVSMNKKIKILMLGLVAIAIFVVLWNMDTGIPAIDLMLQRIKKIYRRFVESGSDAALSGRVEIWNAYLTYWKGLSPVQQMFGTAALSHSAAHEWFYHAHNTFIDMILYVGVVPFLIWIVYVIGRIREFWKTMYGEQIFLLKISYLLVGMSVSMLTGCYWWIIVIL